MSFTIDVGTINIIPEGIYNGLFSKYPKLKKGEGRIYIKNNRTGEEYSHEISNDEFRDIYLSLGQWYQNMFSILQEGFTDAGLNFHPGPLDRQLAVKSFRQKRGEFVISLDSATKEQRKEIDGLARKLEKQHDIKIDIL